MPSANSKDRLIVTALRRPFKKLSVRAIACIWAFAAKV
jgi:hypothetical protein